jgi:hypothetical protein
VDPPPPRAAAVRRWTCGVVRRLTCRTTTTILPAAGLNQIRRRAKSQDHQPEAAKMPTQTKQPPTLPGVTWSGKVTQTKSYGRVDDEMVGEASQLFWRYYRPQKQALYNIGVSVFDADGYGAWRVRWRPRYDGGQRWRTDAEADVAAHKRLEDTLQDICEFLIVQDVECATEAIKFGPHPVLTRWIDVICKTAYIAKGVKLAEEAKRRRANAELSPSERAALFERVSDAIYRHGLALVGFDILGKFDTCSVITFDDADKINDRLARAKKRATEFSMEEAAENAHANCLLTDDFVRDCLVYLTAADTDRASISNGKGWSKSDSERGHWATAAINDPDTSEKALRMGRRLIKKYALTQLQGLARRHGITADMLTSTESV